MLEKNFRGCEPEVEGDDSCVVVAIENGKQHDRDVKEQDVLLALLPLVEMCTAPPIVPGYRFSHRHVYTQTIAVVQLRSIVKLCML